MVYPWQQDQWQQLIQQNKRLPHALLLTGIRGIGKAHFAVCFMRAQLCQATYSDLCNCHSCRLIAGKSHPNILWIEPEKAGGAIKVDQIREVSDFVNQTSLQGEYRFVLIDPASSMNINAANALLKTLEEPAAHAILILISEQASHLPATVLSRCQHLHFPRPEKSLAHKWLADKISTDVDLALQLTHGAPLAALHFAQQDKFAVRASLLQVLHKLVNKQLSVLSGAAEINEIDISFLLDTMLTVITDILHLHYDDQELINTDFRAQLMELQQQTSSQQLIAHMNFLMRLRAQQQQGFNHNKQLLIENLFIRWMECAHVSG